MRGIAGAARRRARQLAVALPLLGLPAAAGAQDAEASGPGPLARAGITGSLRAGYWSSTRDLDQEEHLGEGMLWLKMARPIAGGASFLVEGWTAVRGPAAGDDATGELREAFLDLRLGRLDLRAGRQIIAWGRADGINPTDNITGEDLTLLAPDDDERRLGTTALRASYYLGGVAVTGLWLPEFRGHRFPLPAALPREALSRHVERWATDRWALRVERTGGAVDWSVSHQRGVDLMPDLGFEDAGPGAGLEAPPDGGPGGRIRLAHHRIRVFGADLAANVGRFALRAEGAYVDTDDAGGRDPFSKNPYVFLVVGGDRTFREYLNLNVQYLHRRVLDFRPMAAGLPAPAAAVAAQQAILNSETRRVQHGASFRLAHRWLRETLEAECAAAAFFGPRGLTVRPKVVYAVSDGWKLVAGAEVYRGEAESVFGLLRPNSTAYLEARWSF